MTLHVSILTVGTISRHVGRHYLQNGLSTVSPSLTWKSQSENGEHFLHLPDWKLSFQTLGLALISSIISISFFFPMKLLYKYLTGYCENQIREQM